MATTHDVTSSDITGYDQAALYFKNATMNGNVAYVVDLSDYSDKLMDLNTVSVIPSDPSGYFPGYSESGIRAGNISGGPINMASVSPAVYVSSGMGIYANGDFLTPVQTITDATGYSISWISDNTLTLMAFKSDDAGPTDSMIYRFYTWNGSGVPNYVFSHELTFVSWGALLSGDGSLLATYHDGVVKILRVSDGAELASYTFDTSSGNSLSCVAPARDLSWVALSFQTGDGDYGIIPLVFSLDGGFTANDAVMFGNGTALVGRSSGDSRFFIVLDTANVVSPESIYVIWFGMPDVNEIARKVFTTEDSYFNASATSVLYDGRVVYVDGTAPI